MLLLFSTYSNLKYFTVKLKKTVRKGRIRPIITAGCIMYVTKVSKTRQLVKNITLFRLAAALGQGSSRERAELCNSLHTCHRKCLKEPPGDMHPSHTVRFEKDKHFDK